MTAGWARDLEEGSASLATWGRGSCREKAGPGGEQAMGRQCPDGLPHLGIDVSSVLKQEFYEWLVPLQSGNVKTGQTWGEVGRATDWHSPALSPPFQGPP